jgi:hypothetical protein
MDVLESVADLRSPYPLLILMRRSGQRNTSSPSRPEEFHHRPLPEPCVRVSLTRLVVDLRTPPYGNALCLELERFVLVAQLTTNPHPTTPSALLHPHYRGFTATIG